jgi:type II secretory pathway pseudopilin PulG
LARRRRPSARSSSSARVLSVIRLAAGFSALELLFVVSLMATICGMAVPPVLSGIDTMRAAGAARYVAARLQRARMEAVLRSANVAMRVTQTPTGYELAVYVDGNGNGVLTRDIDRGVDWRLGSAERLPENFVGVDFGVLPGLPAVDPGGAPPGADPIRLGASDLAAFTPGGTSSSGSVYIRGRQQQQYVVRIYGDTGKTRILAFDERTRRWKPL